MFPAAESMSCSCTDCQAMQPAGSCKPAQPTPQHTCFVCRATPREHKQAAPAAPAQAHALVEVRRGQLHTAGRACRWQQQQRVQKHKACMCMHGYAVMAATLGCKVQGPLPWLHTCCYRAPQANDGCSGYGEAYGRRRQAMRLQPSLTYSEVQAAAQ